MQVSGDATTDFVLAAWAAVKWVVWLVVGTPLELWHKAPILCAVAPCWPTGAFVSVFAWMLLLFLFTRIIDFAPDMHNPLSKKVVTFSALFIYLSLVPVYEGILVLEYRAEVEAWNKRVEQNKLKRGLTPAR